MQSQQERFKWVEDNLHLELVPAPRPEQRYTILKMTIIAHHKFIYTRVMIYFILLYKFREMSFTASIKTQKIVDG